MTTAEWTNAEWELHDAATAFDPFYSTIRHQEELPSWLKWRHDVCNRLEQLRTASHSMDAVAVGERLASINACIDAYNRNVPNPHLRRPAVTADNWAEACEAWQ